MVQEFSKCSEPGAGEQSTDAPGGSLEGFLKERAFELSYEG